MKNTLKFEIFKKTILRLKSIKNNGFNEKSDVINN